MLGSLYIFSCVLTRLLQGEHYCPHLRDKQIGTQDFSHLLKVVQSVAELGLEFRSVLAPKAAFMPVVVLCSPEAHPPSLGVISGVLQGYS